MNTIYIIFYAPDDDSSKPILWAEDKELAEAEVERLSRAEYDQLVKNIEEAVQKHGWNGPRPGSFAKWKYQSSYWVEPVTRLEGDVT